MLKNLDFCTQLYYHAYICLRKKIAEVKRGTKIMRSKKRVTVMLYTNADGTYKIPLQFIRKSRGPLCFIEAPEPKKLQKSKERLDGDRKISGLDKHVFISS